MIANFPCIVKQILAERTGNKRDGGEYRRADILVEALDVPPHGKPQQTVVSFYSSSGPLSRLPQVGQAISLTICLSASWFDNRWYNNVRALEFEVIGDKSKGGVE
jgi:hypothetical protein